MGKDSSTEIFTDTDASKRKMNSKENSVKVNKITDASAEEVVKVSVRTLVEFILRSGDIVSGQGRMDPDVMQAGSRIHRKIQKSKGSDYQAEVPLSVALDFFDEEDFFTLLIEGRADGIQQRPGRNFLIDEIKSTYKDVAFLKEAEPVHIAQARCYAYMQAVKEGRIVPFSLVEALPAEKPQETNNTELKEELMVIAPEADESEKLRIRNEVDMLFGNGAFQMTDENGNTISLTDEVSDTIGVQITYCNIESEQKKEIKEELSVPELKEWFEELVIEYKKWAAWERKWRRVRNISIKKLEFPYPYRRGQRDLAAAVYRTITRGRKLFAMAPTGVGKTLSTVFPAIKAMGENETCKLFYLTAKTIVRTVAEESFAILSERGLKFKTVTITAKEKVCILDKPDCNPGACERARGHYDRINNAIYYLLTHEETITRDVILAYAETFCVCPFEFCLDLTLWADAVICDYNYVFDPDVSLKRFFATDQKNDFTFLIDEAHNLPDRAREMYSATLIKENFLETKRLLAKREPGLAKRIDACNKVFLMMKRDCDSFQEEKDFGPLSLALMRLMTECEEYMKDERHPREEREAVLNLYFDSRHFLAMYEFADKDYRFYTTYTPQGEFMARVQCMQPSRALSESFKKGKSAILFSATLLPVQFYMEELAGNLDEYTIYAPSPFLPENRCILIGNDFSGKYTNRGASMYEQAAGYIRRFTSAKKGNYLIFFSSYKMLQEIGDALEKLSENEEEIHILRQKSNMSEREREEYLSAFTEDTTETNLGLCVLGGIFGEGIDLKGERLIGAVIVGTGLPLVCEERELFRRFYEEQGESGFDRAYLYPGMNKVQQAAGRVIRTMNDKGAVLLLDDRFEKRQYVSLFPKEWEDYETVQLDTVAERMQEFWKGVE